MTSYIRRDAERIRSIVQPAGPSCDEIAPVFLVYAVLMRAKGAAVDSADVHDAWAACAEMFGTGGPDLVVPWDELDLAARERDSPFAEAIRLAASDEI